MEQIILFSVIHSVLTKKGIKGKAHQAFIDRLIGNGNLLHYLFSQLYSNREDIDSRFVEILELIIDSYKDRNPSLLKRDQNKNNKGSWFLSNDLVGMSLYVDRFAVSLGAMPKKLDYLQELDVQHREVLLPKLYEMTENILTIDGTKDYINDETEQKILITKIEDFITKIG